MDRIDKILFHISQIFPISLRNLQPLKEIKTFLKMDYKNGKCNIPFFYYEETQKQISKTGGREWKSEEEIIKEHAKYNTKGKADVIGWISEELAREIAEVSHFLYIVTLGYM